MVSLYSLYVVSSPKLEMEDVESAGGLLAMPCPPRDSDENAYSKDLLFPESFGLK